MHIIRNLHFWMDCYGFEEPDSLFQCNISKDQILTFLFAKDYHVFALIVPNAVLKLFEFNC